MPAGVSWTRYMSFLTASMLSMFAGSQVVHEFYRPLDNLNNAIREKVEQLEKIEKELEKQRKLNVELNSTRN